MSESYTHNDHQSIYMELKRQERPEHAITGKKSWQADKVDAENFIDMISIDTEKNFHGAPGDAVHK